MDHRRSLRLVRGEARVHGCDARPITSSVGPYLFLMPLTSRKAWWRSPSIYMTVSTMCSSTLGPAMSPACATCLRTYSELGSSQFKHAGRGRLVDACS